MEYVTTKIPSVSEHGDAARIASYLRAQKQELNHALESLALSLFARIRKAESAGLLTQGGPVSVISAGERDGWQYRRYSDGTAECHGRFRCEGIKCTEAWGGAYISPDFGGGSFPFEFAEVPNVQYSISGTGARGYLLGYPSGDGSATATSVGKWWFARGTASTAADVAYVDVRAFGRLKDEA